VIAQGKLSLEVFMVQLEVGNVQKRFEDLGKRITFEIIDLEDVGASFCTRACNFGCMNFQEAMFSQKRSEYVLDFRLQSEDGMICDRLLVSVSRRRLREAPYP